MFVAAIALRAIVEPAGEAIVCPSGRKDTPAVTVRSMDADAALVRTWNLGEGEYGWSDAVMDEAERLLPILIEAGYAETKGNTWNFTAMGVARAVELERAYSGDKPLGCASVQQYPRARRTLGARSARSRST